MISVPSFQMIPYFDHYLANTAPMDGDSFIQPTQGCMQLSKEELHIQQPISSTPTHNTTTRSLFGLENGMLEQKRKLGSRKQNDRERNPFEKVVCYWAILSIRSSDPNVQLSRSNLAILHLDQTLEEILGSSVQLHNGISVLDFIHPNEARRIEMEIAQYTSERRANSKVLRCMMKSVTSIVRNSQLFSTGYSSAQLKDDDYQLTDIRSELIGDGMMLCFFHAVEGIDKRNDDDDENKQSQRSGCCKTMLNTFNDQQCQKLWQHIFFEKMIETSSSKVIERHWNGFPKKIFQILSNVSQSNVLFSWPPPRIFDSMQQQQQQHHGRSKSNSDSYMGCNNYSANDFARLTYQSTFRENLLARPEELTTCKRSQSLSFNVLIDGLDIDLEVLVIPHGEIKFAIFSIRKADVFLAHLTDRKDLSNDEQISSPITFDRGLTLLFPTTFPEQCNQFLPAYVPPNYRFPMSLPSSSSLKPTLTPALAQHESLINVKADTSKYGILAHSQTNPVSYEGIATSSKAVSLQTQAEIESGDPKQVGHTSKYEFQNGLPSSSSSPSYPLTFTKPITNTNVNLTTMMKTCLICGTLNSPEWRKGSDGKKSLCNACGLRFSRNNRRRRKKEENEKIANEVAANGGTIPAHIRKRIEDEYNRKKVELSKKTKNKNSKPPLQTQRQQQQADKDGMDALIKSSTISDIRSSPSMHSSSSKMNLITNPHHLPENTSPTSAYFPDHQISSENMLLDFSPYISVYQNFAS